MRYFNGRRAAGASVVEPIFEKPPVVRLPQREESHDQPQPAEAVWREAPEMLPIPGLADMRTQPGVRPVSFRISDSRPLLAQT
jgi:hypothetical protein